MGVSKVLDRLREVAFAGGVDHLARLLRHIDAELVELALRPAADLARVLIVFQPFGLSAVVAQDVALRLVVRKAREGTFELREPQCRQLASTGALTVRVKTLLRRRQSEHLNS